eukprot:2201872-Pleurochrysis_carterae.AAC.3
MGVDCRVEIAKKHSLPSYGLNQDNKGCKAAIEAELSCQCEEHYAKRRSDSDGIGVGRARTLLLARGSKQRTLEH